MNRRICFMFQHKRKSNLQITQRNLFDNRMKSNLNVFLIKSFWLNRPGDVYRILKGYAHFIG